jgi:hypothetical protein
MVIKSKKMKWMRHLIEIRESRNAYGVSLVNPARNKPLMRSKHRWEDA